MSDEERAANLELDARIRARVQATHFGPTEGIVVEADADGNVVWRWVGGPESLNA